jgi:hypothetical protein
MPTYICVTCGTQFAPSAEPPPDCPICLDERQYVGPGGQRWTTSEEFREAHHSRVDEIEPELIGVGVDPSVAIGQRELHVESLLWDCVPLDADPGVPANETIAIPHPHNYTTMVDWAERFDARVLLHEADREWVMRPSPRIEYWSGERRKNSGALELVRLGGHFAGGTVCLWRDGAHGRGVLFSGDILQVVSDRNWVSFMWSYPNLIPLPAAEIERVRAVVESLDFDRIYGAWWDRVIETDAKAKVLRSADRYVDAITRGRS